MRGIRALRDAIERGDVEGPTIVNAGAPISVTGGHGDPLNGLAEPFAHAVAETVENTCDGPHDCRRAVRRQIGLGAQVIKFMATGGVLSNVSGGLGRAMQPEEMKAIVETAHALGRKTAAHSHAAEGTRAAVEDGVDTIDHGTFLDDATIKLMKARGTWLVPTMLAPRAALAQARGGMLPPATIPKAEAAGAAAVDSHRRAIAAGVKIAFGTDTGVSKHGDNAQEFALMAAAGMTPAQAIKAATMGAAEALDRPGLGQIAPGLAADIIASIRDIFGGRSGAYEEVLERGRREAIVEMVERGRSLGGDALVGVDLDYQVLGKNGSMLMISVNGTAVKLRRELPGRSL